MLFYFVGKLYRLIVKIKNIKKYKKEKTDRSNNTEK